MNYLKILILYLIGSFVTTQGNAQDININHHEIGVQVGFSYASVKEERYSEMTKKFAQIKLGAIYSKWNDKSRIETTISYATNSSPTSPKSLWYKIINPEFNYSYQRKVANTWIGGSFQSTTLLLFPENSQKLFENNPISYTIVQSLGVAIDRSFELINDEKHQFNLDMGFRSSLLSHVIRPSYAHPYPDHYLQEEVFSPTRSGMWKSIIKSGKLRTINKYNAMRVVLGVNYIYQNQVKIGVQYNANLLNNYENKKLSYSTHDVILGVSYIY